MSAKDLTSFSENKKQTVLCYEFNPKTDILGKGAYGEVYRATYAKLPGRSDTNLDPTEKVVAIKKTRCGSKEEGIPSSTIREVMVLKEISKNIQNTGDNNLSSETFGSENIVRLYDVFIDTDTVFLVSEFCEGGDLSRHIRKLPQQRVGDGKQYRQWMWELLSGLCFLHNKNFSHRDLKPENLVLKAIKRDGNNSGENEGQKYRLKITDFGLSRLEGIPVKKYQHECVTLWYRSPDVLLGNTNYGCTVDMWSAGCIIGEVATGRALFRGKNSNDQLKCIFTRLGTPTLDNFPSIKQYSQNKALINCLGGIGKVNKSTSKNSCGTSFVDIFESTKKRLFQYFKRHSVMDIVGENGVDLIAHLLAYEPKHRLTAHEAIQHPFFSILRHNVVPKLKPLSRTTTFSSLTLKDDDRSVNCGSCSNGPFGVGGELSQFEQEEDCQLESI